MKKTFLLTALSVMAMGTAYAQQNETFTVNKVSFTMVYVEGGTFTMGKDKVTDQDFRSDEPAHQETVGSFYCGETEVTQELWTAVMGKNPSRYTDSNQNPVEQVSWGDCRHFVAKLNQLTGKQFRLLTEAEWEFAAKGGTKSKGYVYSGSNDLQEVAWCFANSGDRPHAVKQKMPNELGIYDMTGNVYEWTSSGYSRYGTEPTLKPNEGGYRFVYRGGCDYTDERFSVVHHRNHGQISDAGPHRGMRLALDAK